MPTRAKRPVGRGWPGTGAARLGGAETPTGLAEGELDLLGGVMVCHGAPSTLDQNWDRTWDPRKNWRGFSATGCPTQEPRCALLA